MCSLCCLRPKQTSSRLFVAMAVSLCASFCVVVGLLFVRQAWTTLLSLPAFRLHCVVPALSVCAMFTYSVHELVLALVLVLGVVLGVVLCSHRSTCLRGACVRACACLFQTRPTTACFRHLAPLSRNLSARCGSSLCSSASSPLSATPPSKSARTPARRNTAPRLVMWVRPTKPATCTSCARHKTVTTTTAAAATTTTTTQQRRQVCGSTCAVSVPAGCWRRSRHTLPNAKPLMPPATFRRLRTSRRSGTRLAQVSGSLVGVLADSRLLVVLIGFCGGRKTSFDCIPQPPVSPGVVASGWSKYRGVSMRGDSTVVPNVACVLPATRHRVHGNVCAHACLPLRA